MEIKGMSEKKIEDKKFIYIPLMVSIRATIKGIDILSLILGITINSVIVATIDTIKATIKGILNMNKITNVVIKKAKVPSNDLFNNLVFPNPTPIMAAIASAKLITINAIPAAF
jgi:hypothetical protein